MSKMNVREWLVAQGYDLSEASHAHVHACVTSLCDEVDDLFVLQFDDFVASGLKVGTARALLAKMKYAKTERQRLQESSASSANEASMASTAASAQFRPTASRARQDSPEPEDFLSSDVDRDRELILPPMALMLTGSSGRSNFGLCTWADSANIKGLYDPVPDTFVERPSKRRRNV